MMLIFKPLHYYCIHSHYCSIHCCTHIRNYLHKIPDPIHKSDKESMKDKPARE